MQGRMHGIRSGGDGFGSGISGMAGLVAFIGGLFGWARPFLVSEYWTVAPAKDC